MDSCGEGGAPTRPRAMSPGVLALSLHAAESLPSAEEMKKLTWLFGCPLSLGDVAQESWLCSGCGDLLLEVGPRQVSQPRAIRSACPGTPPSQTHRPTPCFHSSPSPLHDPWWVWSSFAPSYSLPGKPCMTFPIWEGACED